VSTEITVVFDDNQLQNNKVFHAIAMVGAKIPALIDYKIHSSLTGEEQDSVLVQTIEDAIDLLLNVDVKQKNDFEYLTLLSAFTMELCDFAYDGKLNKLSSASLTAKLVENATLESANAEFMCAKKVIKRYLTAFNLEQGGQNVSDYKLIAERLSVRLNKNFDLISKDIFYKTEVLSVCGKMVNRMRVLMKNMVARAEKEIASIDKLYKVFGGTKSCFNKKINEYLELSGYVGRVINGMTLVSELGL
jgi:hypothetical protein